MKAAVTAVWFWLLWLALAGSWAGWEMAAAAVAAALAAAGSERLRRSGYAPFAPRLRWLALALRLPGAVAASSLQLAWAALRQPPPAARLVQVDFAQDESGGRAAARRALAVAYTNVSPTSVVIRMEPAAESGRERIFVHQLPVGEVPAVIRKLAGGQP
jgi:multisubunit Na+/H+ antiporter MnhE subunit